MLWGPLAGNGTRVDSDSLHVAAPGQLLLVRFRASAAPCTGVSFCFLGVLDLRFLLALLLLRRLLFLLLFVLLRLHCSILLTVHDRRPFSSGRRHEPTAPIDHGCSIFAVTNLSGTAESTVPRWSYPFSIRPNAYAECACSHQPARREPSASIGKCGIGPFCASCLQLPKEPCLARCISL